MGSYASRRRRRFGDRIAAYAAGGGVGVVVAAAIALSASGMLAAWESVAVATVTIAALTGCCSAFLRARTLRHDRLPDVPRTVERLTDVRVRGIEGRAVALEATASDVMIALRAMIGRFERRGWPDLRGERRGAMRSPLTAVLPVVSLTALPAIDDAR